MFSDIRQQKRARNQSRTIAPRAADSKSRAKAASLVPIVPTRVSDNALPTILPAVCGYVDFHGYHTGAGGWFIGGWIAHPWAVGHRPRTAVAELDDGSLIERTHAMFHHRDDVAGHGIGFVFFLTDDAAKGRSFRTLRIIAEDGATYVIDATPHVLVLNEAALLGHLRPMLADGQKDSQRREMWQRLFGVPIAEPASGYVDFYGYHEAAGGWLFCGWVSRGWTEGEAPERVAVAFQESDVEGDVFAALYPRHDLSNGAEGFICFVRGPATVRGSLCSVSFDAGAMRAVLHAPPTASRLREAEIVARLRPLLAQASAHSHPYVIAELISRRPFAGEDTLASLQSTVLLEIDEAILCGSAGLVLMGWCLAAPGYIRDIRVRAGSFSASIDLSGGILIDRRDVLDAFAQHGFDDPRCGYIAFLPWAAVPDGVLHLEVETDRGEVAYRRIPVPKLAGMAAMKRLLEVVDVRFGDVRSAFDGVLGPAIEGLNNRRLANRPAIEVVDYGVVPTKPRFSMIIPLYGRLDFVEYQLAMFSSHPRCAEIEFIYVLDDPPKRREARFLFASAYERFQIPFRAVLPDRNVGFAPANNIGLDYAHGEYVAYVNSDVFPGTPDWLDQLANRLIADPKLGVVGPLLLFEDGSVQHRGMHFERLPEFGNWLFGQHQGKGMRLPTGTHGVQRSISITGACMLMTRALANQLGGFDEVYAIGDFEDTDLCLKLQALGLECAVDTDVQLFHLERKSQAGSAVSWRMNLTLYNAWQHERRWGATTVAERAA